MRVKIFVWKKTRPDKDETLVLYFTRTKISRLCFLNVDLSVIYYVFYRRKECTENGLSNDWPNWRNSRKNEIDLYINKSSIVECIYKNLKKYQGKINLSR